MRWLIAVACMALLDPSGAEACRCGPPSIEIWPFSNDAVPLNPQIRITWWEGREGSPRGAGSSITLVTGKGSPVATRRRSWISGDLHILVLSPTRPLAPQAEYLVTMPKSRDLPVLYSFTTGTTRDDSPPSWNGTSGTRYIHERERRTNCSSDAPYVQIDIVSSAVNHDRTPAKDIVYGVWPATGPLDHASLLTMTPPGSNEIMLGELSVCSPSNFTVPTRPTQFRVAPIDLAGNIGSPAKITIDPSRPERRRR